jgi:putative flippase GtrA
MGNRELPKLGKVAVFKNFAIFNFAAVIGFILGTAGFAVSLLVYPNPTFAWLFANGIGGVAHFAANYVMQRQTKEKKEKIVKNFIVFNATGLIGFFVSTIAFAATIIYIQDPTAAWFIGSFIGTLAHFILNDKATNLNLNIKLNLKPKRPTSINHKATT